MATRASSSTLTVASTTLRKQAGSHKTGPCTATATTALELVRILLYFIGLLQKNTLLIIFLATMVCEAGYQGEFCNENVCDGGNM